MLGFVWCSSSSAGYLWYLSYGHWYSPSFLCHLKRENDDHVRERINLRTRITKRREGHQILVHEIHRLTLFLFGKKRATIDQSSYFNHPIFGEYQWSQPRKSHGCLVIKWIAIYEVMWDPTLFNQKSLFETKSMSASLATEKKIFIFCPCEDPLGSRMVQGKVHLLISTLVGGFRFPRFVLQKWNYLGKL